MKMFFEIYSYLTARPKVHGKFGKRGRRPSRRRTGKFPLAKPPESGLIDANRRATPMGHYRTIGMLGRAWGCAGWLPQSPFPLVDINGWNGIQSFITYYIQRPSAALPCAIQESFLRICCGCAFALFLYILPET